MAKIICVTTGLTGILNASFELVDRLQKAGHEVIYASPRKVGQKVKAQGIEFFQLPEIKLNAEPALPETLKNANKLSRLKYKFQNVRERKETAAAEIEPKVFTVFLEKLQPDLLLVDIELHEYIFKAYGKKIPMVLLSQWFSLWNRKGLPYLLSDTIPGEGWRGNALGLSLSWQRIRIKRWWMFTKKRWVSGGTDRRSALLALAEKEKFPLKMIRENYWPGPFTYDALPVVSMTLREMEFPHDFRPNLHYIGAMVYDSRVELTLDAVEENRLSAAIDYQKNHRAALIYCSVSTLSRGDIRFIKKMVTAVKDQQDWILVISMGELLDKNYLAELPENVFAFKRVPQLKVLKIADCSVNHGGIHTINECIHYKVPMLIYSGKRSDQNGCAARVAYHQLGVMADKDMDGVTTIRRKIGEVLNNKKYRTNVEAMHRHYLNSKSNKTAISIIEKFIAKEKL